MGPSVPAMQSHTMQQSAGLLSSPHTGLVLAQLLSAVCSLVKHCLLL